MIDSVPQVRTDRPLSAGEQPLHALLPKGSNQSGRDRQSDPITAVELSQPSGDEKCYVRVDVGNGAICSDLEPLLVLAGTDGGPDISDVLNIDTSIDTYDVPNNIVNIDTSDSLNIDTSDSINILGTNGDGAIGGIGTDTDGIGTNGDAQNWCPGTGTNGEAQNWCPNKFVPEIIGSACSSSYHGVHQSMGTECLGENVCPNILECSSPVRLPQSDPHDLGYQSSETINVFLAPDDAIGGPLPAMPLNNLDDTMGTSRPGYHLVEGVVDSGASKSTGPKRIFRGKLRPSLMSKKGLKFHGPDGT